jgi:hypothetical protein
MVAFFQSTIASILPAVIGTVKRPRPTWRNHAACGNLAAVCTRTRPGELAEARRLGLVHAHREVTMPLGAMMGARVPSPPDR